MRNRYKINHSFRLFFCLIFVIVALLLCSCKDDVANLLAAGTDVYVGCWYNDNVFIFEGTDTHNGKHILDYNSAEGKAFAEFNKINYQDTDYDFKAKYRSILSLPELAAEYHPIVRKNEAVEEVKPEEQTPAEKPAATLDKTQLPTYSTRDKSKKANVGKKNIPADRMPNYDKIFGSGSGEPTQPSAANTNGVSPERPAAGGLVNQSNPNQNKNTVKAVNNQPKNNPPAAGSGQTVPSNQTVPDGTDKKEQSVRSADRSKVQDTVNISEVQVGEIIMDATLDAEYRQRYIFDTQRIAELNGFRDELDLALINALKTLYSQYGVNFVNDVSTVTDENTRLLFDIVKYRPGEFNLIKNIPTDMTIQFRIVNPKYNVDTAFRGDFSCEASAYFPNEKSRLMEISRKITEYLRLKLSMIRVKNLKTVQTKTVTDETADAVPQKPLPPGTADIPADEKIVPINEAVHNKGLKSAGRND